ncbi:phospholipase-like protein, partial [Tanacetum coccineum]
GERKSRGQVGWSRDQVYLEWWPRVLLGVQGGDGGGHSLHFGRPEFALITGLPFGTINFGLYTFGKLKFRNRVFPHKLGLSVTNLDVIGVIKDEVTFRKLCDQDSIRLCLILALEVIFMGWLLTCPMDDTLFQLVENLEDWNCFPWGEHIWTYLYDEIKNVIEKHIDEHYFGMKKDRKYVPTYTLFGFVFAFQVWILKSFERRNCWWIKDPKVIPRALGWLKKSIFKRSDCCYLFTKESTTTTDIRPTITEYESSWWIRNHLEKSRKRAHSSFRVSSSVCTTDIISLKKWFKDEVICELNVRVFKLETIIQVLARERNEEYGVLHFNEEFSSLGRDFMDSLNILFQDLIQPYYSDEDISNEKNIIEEQRFRVEEPKRMRLEEEKLLQIADQQGPVKCKFPWSDDYTVGLIFGLTLACLDPSRKGWLTEEILLQNNTPLFYANDDKYTTPWSDVDQRREQMIEMQPFLHVSTALADSYNLLKEIQDYELEKCRELMKSISETQLKERLPVILLGAKVFDKKGIDPTDYCIRFKLADSVPKQGGIFGDCGVWVCIFLYRLAHGLSLDVEDPFEVALAYREKMLRLYFSHKIDTFEINCNSNI